jgi:tetratricopeptide (TPR) repeat protein
MTDPVISPDGKWMWTGSEWIPAPPSSLSASNSAATQTGDVRDSVVMGDINRQISSSHSTNVSLQDSVIDGGAINDEQTEKIDSPLTATQTGDIRDSVVMGDINHQISSFQSTNVSLQDSVIGGDVIINDEQSMSKIFNQSLDEKLAAQLAAFEERMLNFVQMGFTGNSSPAELTPSQEAEVEEVLEMSEQLTSHGIVLDPWTEITLGNAARITGETQIAQQHYLMALSQFSVNSDQKGKAASLSYLGMIAHIRGDLAEAERLQRDCLAIDREIGDRGGEAGSLIGLGNIAQTRGDLAEAERLSRESLAIMREISDREGEAASLGNLGEIARARGDLAEAEQYLFEAKSVYQEVGDRAGVSRQLLNLGNIARIRGDFGEADRLYQESLTIMREIGDRECEAVTLNNLGSNAQTRGDLAEAERLFREGLALAREISNRQDEAMSLDNIGLISLMRGDLSAAELLQRESLAINRDIGYRGGEENSLRNLGHTYLLQDDLVEAERIFRESLTISREINNKEAEARSLFSLGAVAEKQGILAEAERLYRECWGLAISLGSHGEADILQSLENIAQTLQELGTVAHSNGNYDEQRHRYSEAVRIRRDIGIPIEQWFIDNGY